MRARRGRLAGRSRGADQAGDPRILPFPDFPGDGRGSVRRPLDGSDGAEGNRLHLAGPSSKTAHDRLGHSSWHAVGRCKHADRVCNSERRDLHRVSPLEYKQPGGSVLGLAPLQRAARLRREAVGQGAGRVSRYRGGGVPHCVRHLAPGGRRTAALGAGVLWGTMYIPYRKAYISGMNPLSFVTVFTFGELGTTFVLGAIFHGGVSNLIRELGRARPVLFWLFLGGFCWVIGDLFQQYAAKYIGIGRGIPLSNTNQLWGLAWGALVFGELAGQGAAAQTLVIAGSMIMICGAVAISFAEAPESEHSSWREAMDRECVRYGLDSNRVADAVGGGDPVAAGRPARRWW